MECAKGRKMKKVRTGMGGTSEQEREGGENEMKRESCTYLNTIHLVVVILSAAKSI